MAYAESQGRLTRQLLPQEREWLLRHAETQSWGTAANWKIGRALMDLGLIEFVANPRSSRTKLAKLGAAVRENLWPIQ